jgi:hypothetical protein
MDLNALAQLSALVVAVFNAHGDPLVLLNSYQDILTFPHTPFKVFYPSLSLLLLCLLYSPLYI